MSKALDELIQASVLAWIKEKKVVNEKGRPIKMGKNSPHFFLRALYEDRSDEIAVQKPSQVGVSTWAILTEIHDARYWGINQIHTLPTANDVGKFVPSKVNEIIKRNPCIKEGMSEKEVESVNQKQYGKGFIYYKGTFSERESLMLSSDRNWYDEMDKSDQTSIGFYESRTEGADSLRQKRYISTPTVPNIGINKKIEESDQKHWRYNCGSCGKEQHMKWPENISFERRCYVCQFCDKEITEEMIRGGKWKPRYPAKSPDVDGKNGISGYMINQMICPWIKPGDLIDYYKDAEAGRNEATMEYFFNHKMGLPYVSSESRVTGDLILRNISAKEHTEVDCIMGVDVQERELYAIIGTDEGPFGAIIIPDTPEKGKWDRWAELMQVYDVRHCVIDGGYKPNDSIEASKRFPDKVWVNWYKDDPKKEKIIRWADENFTGKQLDDDAQIRVLTERDRMIDWLLADLKRGGMRFFMNPNSEEVKKLISHIETTYARQVTDRQGKLSREWVSTGKDDFLHALIYFAIARERKRNL